MMATVLRAIAGGSPEAERIGQGLYKIGHFSFDQMLPAAAERWPDLPPDKTGGYRGCYGVCDSPEQLIEKYGDALNAEGRRFVVSFTEVRRDQQGPHGGWRWHKWGQYIGTQEPAHEYLFDDTHIERVFVFHVFELKGDAP